MVLQWSSHLDPNDGVMIDISPKTLGNSPEMPNDISGYNNFYDYMNGGHQEDGYSVNPCCRAAIYPQLVKRGDYAGTGWVFGPMDRTRNASGTLVYHPELREWPPAVWKEIQGSGAVVDDLEWDVKTYFILGGAMHDVAVSTWESRGITTA